MINDAMLSALMGLNFAFVHGVIKDLVM
jgi:hypothetical protein